MICPECDREHVITGKVLVDGAPVPAALVETMVEIACRHGWLELPEPDDGPQMGPSVRYKSP